MSEKISMQDILKAQQGTDNGPPPVDPGLVGQPLPGEEPPAAEPVDPDAPLHVEQVKPNVDPSLVDAAKGEAQRLMTENETLISQQAQMNAPTAQIPTERTFQPEYVIYTSPIQRLRIGKHLFVNGQLRITVEEAKKFDEELPKFNARITSNVRKVTMEAEMERLLLRFGHVSQGGATKGFDSSAFKLAQEKARMTTPPVSTQRIG